MQLRLGLCVSAAAVAVVAAAGAFSSSGGGMITSEKSSPAATTRDRAVTDMPDDLSGPQIHFLYVVPSDGADGQLDTNGAMEQSIVRITRWFVAQTGDQGLRVDTYNGVPDITFVRLPHSNAQATSTNPWPLWVIGEDLVAAGFNDPAKAYAAFYDGHSSWACGGAKSPALPKLGAMYLKAQPTNDPRPCSDAPGLGTGADHPGYFEIGLIHEVFHTLGFSPHCAPHRSQDGFGDHVDDSPTDLMYGPDATHTAGWDWSHAVLDFNHDDYYRAHIPGCPDLADSPYVMQVHSVSVTVTGRGAVTSSPPGIACPDTTCEAAFPGGVTLTATPSTGTTFVGWKGACTGTSSTCTIPSGGSVTATFTQSAPPAKPSPRCTVPNVKGKTLIAAKNALRANHCSTGTIRRVYSPTVKAGRVISQNPAAGRRFPVGHKTNLVVSRGRRRS